MINCCKEVWTSCCGEDSYIRNCWKISEVPDSDGTSQRSRDPLITSCTRLTQLISLALTILSVIFCSLMLSYNRSLEFYIPLFAVTTICIPIPVFLRSCCCVAAKAPPKKKPEPPAPPQLPPLPGAPAGENAGGDDA